MDYARIRQLAENPRFSEPVQPKVAELIKPKQGNRIRVHKFCIVDVEKNEKLIWLPLENPIFPIGTNMEDVRTELMKKVGIKVEKVDGVLKGHTIDFSYVEDKDE